MPPMPPDQPSECAPQTASRQQQDHQTQQNIKNVARRILIEVVDGANLDLADELIAPDYLEHRSGAGEGSPLEGFKEWVRTVHGGFPDWRHTIDDLIAEGDKVVVRNRVFGTHRGEFMGIAPTGKQVEQAGIDIMRIQDGRMVEHWGVYDWHGLYQQLGVLPKIP